MSKNIVIFSDGTGQNGGLKADQNRTNVYKMFRAMRSGPVSKINPKDQICFYDPGLGTTVDTSGTSRIKRILGSAFGSGIDENIIDCYEQIISYYEPGDKIILIGFSRGAYTVRCLANVMSLCGIPTELPNSNGRPIPKSGKMLRKIASDAVLYVYNHGAGKPRGQQPFFKQREELGKRFRAKYKSYVPTAEKDICGNVQPDFIGVFDTVASLKNNALLYAIATSSAAIFIIWAYYNVSGFSFFRLLVSGFFLLLFSIPLLLQIKTSFKYFSPSPNKTLRFRNPKDWLTIASTGHFAIWNWKNYDRYLDPNVGFARHALAIDEKREKFPRVQWAMPVHVKRNADQNPKWLKQIWFAGCHSDIGGSYPENESRLSDISLDWMVNELRQCIPEIIINEDMLNRFPDPEGLQHDERKLKFGFEWRRKLREIDPNAELHPSVYERLQAQAVPIVDEVKAYRPCVLRSHNKAKKYYL